MLAAKLTHQRNVAHPSFRVRMKFSPPQNHPKTHPTCTRRFLHPIFPPLFCNTPRPTAEFILGNHAVRRATCLIARTAPHHSPPINPCHLQNPPVTNPPTNFEWAPFAPPSGAMTPTTASDSTPNSPASIAMARNGSLRIRSAGMTFWSSPRFPITPTPGSANSNSRSPNVPATLITLNKTTTRDILPWAVADLRPPLPNAAWTKRFSLRPRPRPRASAPPTLTQPVSSRVGERQIIPCPSRISQLEGQPSHRARRQIRPPIKGSHNCIRRIIGQNRETGVRHRRVS